MAQTAPRHTAEIYSGKKQKHDIDDICAVFLTLVIRSGIAAIIGSGYCLSVLRLAMINGFQPFFLLFNHNVKPFVARFDLTAYGIDIGIGSK